MALIQMKALQSFTDQEGDIDEGQLFLVNDERCFVLQRTGKAERSYEVTEDAKFQSFVLEADDEKRE